MRRVHRAAEILGQACLLWASWGLLGFATLQNEPEQLLPQLGHCVSCYGVGSLHVSMGPHCASCLSPLGSGVFQGQGGYCFHTWTHLLLCASLQCLPTEPTCLHTALPCL